MNQAEERRKRI